MCLVELIDVDETHWDNPFGTTAEVGENMGELVSIGMPVFNDKQFLVPALESLLAQSYTNFELIISDDGSTDGSETVCRAYAARDERIRYIRQPVNLGISRNMMFLLKQGRGEYFMWAADDDLWHREFIAKLHNALQQDSDSISAFTPMCFIDEEGERLSKPAPRANDYSAPSPYERLKKLIHIFDDSFGYGLFRREAIAKVRFPVWWWVNRDNAYNNIYPTLCHYLARGNFALVGEAPMLYKRVKSKKNTNYKTTYSYFAFVLWKLNLVVVSLNEVARAGKVWTAIRVFPSMFFRWTFMPALKGFTSRVSSLWKRSSNSSQATL